MTYPQVQSYFVGLIAASSALNALGAAIPVDPFADPETTKAAIATQLRTKGVAIEIGFPYIGAAQSNKDGSTHIEATVEVYVAEEIKLAHTPSKLALVNEVVLACTSRPTATFSQVPPQLRAAESVKTEKGYILHMFSFFIPMNIKPSSSLSTPQV
jgi:hypothetical protein